MVIKAQENSVAAWVFFAGVVLACVIGLSTTLIPIPALAIYSKQIYAILVILGLAVGFYVKVNNRKDSQSFLLTSAVLVVVSRFGMESVQGSLIGIGIGDAVSSVFGALLALFVPATIVVALKAMFSMTRV